MPIKYGRFQSSEKFQGIQNHPEVEVIRNPPEWKYVEELLGMKFVPTPDVKAEYPSGWKPQDPETYKHLPYYVKRTKNHMLPVFLDIKHRGFRRLTFIKHIEGDIWQLEKEVVEIIKERLNKDSPVYTQINEMTGMIKIKGDYVTLVQKYLLNKGL